MVSFFSTSNTVLCFFFTLGKSTLSLITFAKYEWFEEWKDEKVTNRGPDYMELKQAFINTSVEMVMDVFPKITRDKVKTQIVADNVFWTSDSGFDTVMWCLLPYILIHLRFFGHLNNI